MLDGIEHTPGTINPSPPQVPARDLRRLAAFGVATVSSALSGPLARQRLLGRDDLPRVTGQGPVAGTALTVWNPPGSCQIIVPALEMIQPGDIVVVSGDMEAATWGDVASTIAQAKGAVGAVIDGVVRDVDRIAALGFSTWAARVFAGQGFRHQAGLVNVPISVKGMVVRPGDVVIADGDGLFSLPRDAVNMALEKAEEREALEERALELGRRGIVADELKNPNFEITAEMASAYSANGASRPVPNVAGPPASSNGHSQSSRRSLLPRDVLEAVDQARGERTH